MRIYTCIIAMLCCTVLMGAGQAAWAQKTVHGTITDAESGAALPIAHIRVEGRFQGTISNSLGEYEITIGEVPADISVTYIGYHSRRIGITGSMPDSLDIALTPNPVVLEEIVVTPEDPAVRIMREVIRRKQEWRAALENWKADAYTRTSLANDDRIALIAESISNVYWKAGKGTEETIISKRQTKNIGIEDNFAMARIMPNLYDDDIEILGFDIIGLTHPDALDYYSFELTGQRMRDDRIVYDISATPKKKLQPSFVGTLAVLDVDYAMIAVDVVPNDAVMFPPPLNRFDIGFRQQFDSFGGEAWLPVDVQISGSLSLKLPGLKFPPMNYRQMTRLTGYEINVALSDSVFQERERTVTVSLGVANGASTVSVSAVESTADDTRREQRQRHRAERDERDSGRQQSVSAGEVDASGGESVTAGEDSPDRHANDPVGPDGDDTRADVLVSDAAAVPSAPSTAEADSIFASSPLVVPYDADEKRAYAAIDSTDNPGDAFRPTGFLANLAGVNKPEQKHREPNRFGRAFAKITEPFTPRLSFNRVDGAGVGLMFSRNVGRDVRFSATGVYRAEREDWAHGADITWYWNDHRGSLGVDYGIGTVPRYRSARYPELLTSVVSLAGGDDYYDYYHAERLGVAIGYYVQRFNTSVGLRYSDEDHSSLGSATDYALFGSRTSLRPNPFMPEATLRSVTLSVNHGTSAVAFGLAGERRATFDVEISAPGAFGGDYAFTRYAMQVGWRFETFLRRRLLANVLDVRIMGGYTDGDTVPARFGVLDGSIGAFGPFGVFRSLRSHPMEGKHYAGVFWEHNFRTAPFELMGLQQLAEKGIGIIVHGASGRTWCGELNGAGHSFAADDTRHEFGLSVSGIFGFLRADVTKRLDSPGWFGGIGLARLF